MPRGNPKSFLHLAAKRPNISEEQGLRVQGQGLGFRPLRFRVVGLGLGFRLLGF